jgi:hypothetical protein
MRSIYGILFGTLFIVSIKASFLDKAISFPDDPLALFNAGTELYLQDDYSKATIFLERSKRCCAQNPDKDLKLQELAENISLNLAHSLVKAEKYQDALAEYKDLFCKFKNPKAEKNIPILEKFLQQQEQQDKQNKDDQEQNQDQDNEQNQETKDQDLKNQDTNQDAGPHHNQNNSNKRTDNQSDQSKNNFDKKKKQEKNQKFDKDQDQKEEKLEHQQQKNKQKENDPDRKKNQEHTANPLNDSINSKNQNQNKQKITNEQLLDKDEKALLQAIENFDQDMMKMYAAANCGGDEEDGW